MGDSTMDEKKCAHFHNCPDGFFMCLLGDCISAKKRCDSIKDCPDGDDERACFAMENGTQTNVLNSANLHFPMDMEEMMRKIDNLKKELSEKGNAIEGLKKTIEELSPAEIGRMRATKDKGNRTAVELPISESEINTKMEIIEMKGNKWNDGDCGPELSISEEGFVANHSGPLGHNNCVRTLVPIPSYNFKSNNKTVIAFYYEVEILNKNDGWIDGIFIGFCDQQFPLKGLENRLGLKKNSNSIGFSRKQNLFIGGDRIPFGPSYEESFVNGDFAGIGITHESNEKMECFITNNGELMGVVELPAKFTSIELFPAVNLFHIGDSIRAHFNKEEWKFKDFQRVLEFLK